MDRKYIVIKSPIIPPRTTLTSSINIASSSSQGKRSRADSNEVTYKAGPDGFTKRPYPKRPRAMDIPLPVRAAPESWKNLSESLNTAWTYNASISKTIREGTHSMRMEDLNSRIVTKGKLCIITCITIAKCCN